MMHGRMPGRCSSHPIAVLEQLTGGQFSKDPPPEPELMSGGTRRRPKA